MATVAARLLIRTSGDFAVSNFDLVRFFASPGGVAAITLTALSTVVTAFVQLSAIILVTGLLREKTRPRFLPLLVKLGQSLPPLSVLGARMLLVAAAPVATAVAIFVLIARPILSTHDVNYLLEVRPPEFIRAVWIGLALIATAGVVSVMLHRALGPRHPHRVVRASRHEGGVATLDIHDATAAGQGVPGRISLGCRHGHAHNGRDGRVPAPCTSRPVHRW